ncbi:hypothetical protein ACLB1N_31460 [Escherichia coli]
MYQRPDFSSFITWFPVYLVQARGMSILKAGFVAPFRRFAVCIGGVLGWDYFRLDDAPHGIAEHCA